MFQNIDVDDRVELLTVELVGERADDDLATGRQGLSGDALFQLSSQSGIRLEADPSIVVATAQQSCRPANSCADLQHLVAQIAVDMPAKIRLPVRRAREEIEFVPCV